MRFLRRRWVVVVLAMLCLAATAGVFSSVRAQLDIGRQQARQSGAIDSFAVARPLEELATSALNLSPELRDLDPVEEILEDVDDEAELTLTALVAAPLTTELEARITAEVDEVRESVDAERADLSATEALSSSIALRGLIDEIFAEHAEFLPVELVETRSDAAVEMIAVVSAIISGSEYELDAAQDLNERLHALAGTFDSSLFDEEVDMAYEDPDADIESIDQLSEIVLSLTGALERHTVALSTETSSGPTVAYGIALLVSLIMLGGFLVGTRIARGDEVERLRHAAGHDVLTGLANRSQLHKAYKAMRPGRSRPVGVLYIDLDKFKPINDSFGHHVGDEVLRRIGQAIREMVRADDAVARLGGDEFAVLISGARTEVEIVDVAQRVVARLNEDMLIDGQRVDVGASGGACIVTSASTDLAGALRDADAALFAAKRAGRGRLLTSDALAEESSSHTADAPS